MVWFEKALKLSRGVNNSSPWPTADKGPLVGEPSIVGVRISVLPKIVGVFKLSVSERIRPTGLVLLCKVIGLPVFNLVLVVLHDGFISITVPPDPETFSSWTIVN